MAKNSKSKSDQVLAQQLAEQGVTNNDSNTGATSGATTNFTPDGVVTSIAVDSNKELETQDANTSPEENKPKRGRPAGSKNKERDPNAPPKVTTPRIRVPAGTKPSEVLALHVPDIDTRHKMMRLTLDDQPGEDNSNIVAGIIDKLAKKVGEKAVNLLRHSENRDRVQIYTQIGLDMLIADGKLTSKGLVDKFSATKYRIGTARAQGSQLMQLFPALGIVKQGSAKGELIPNKRSVLLRNYGKSVSQPKSEAINDDAQAT